MTSTSFNVGLTGEKNSSRVLRPPGGAHSDIFGMRDNENALVTPSKRRHQPQSTISACFNMEEKIKENDSQPKNKDITKGEAVNGKEKGDIDNEIDENTVPSEAQKKIKNEKEEIQTTVTKRVRVPPGGFSSGLW